MKLYYAPKTRSSRPRWLLEELGVPYELVPLDLTAESFPGEEYLKIHPLGVVPALEDNGTVIFESVAICAYLADKYPEKRLAPRPGTAERGKYYQWLFFATATLEGPIIQLFETTIDAMDPTAPGVAQAAEKARERWSAAARVLEREVADKEWLLGAHFTAADVVIGSLLVWGKFMGLLEGFPALQAYVKRLGARPANKRSRD